MRRVLVTALAAASLTGCGVASNSSSGSSTSPQQSDPTALHGHPQAVEPVPGAGLPAGAGAGAPSDVSVGPSNGPLPQPATDAQIRQELVASGISANSAQGTLTPGGLALTPINAPGAVASVIAAGNQIARLPYRWGGGHGTYEDSAYDCSGSLSFVLSAAGLLNTTETSGQLMSWGKPGLGKWITVFAAPGHTFMYVAGLRFDTVALAETGTRWSNRAANEPDLSRFVARHPAGL